MRFISMMGRQAYRAIERFEAGHPGRFTLEGETFDAVTQIIAEGGFIFALAHPAYLPDDVALTLRWNRGLPRAVRGRSIHQHVRREMAVSCPALPH